MKITYTISTLVGVIFSGIALIGCSDPEPVQPTAEPQTFYPATEVAITEPTQTLTATKTQEPSLEVPPTVSSTPTPLPTEIPAAQPPTPRPLPPVTDTYFERMTDPPENNGWPVLVWIDAQSGGDMLVVDSQGMRFEPLPTEVSRFYAYDPAFGLMYFSETVNPSGYGDLSIYDFSNGEVLQLTDTGVIDLALCGSLPAAAVFNGEQVTFSMPYTMRDSFIGMGLDVDPHFSCMPGRIRTRDGGNHEMLAYFRGSDLFFVNWFDGPTDVIFESGPNTAEIPLSPPIWDLEHEVILVHSTAGLRFIPFGNSRYYPAEEMIAPQPFEILYPHGGSLNEFFSRNGEIETVAWSPIHQTLVLEHSDPERVHFISLSDRLQYVVDDYLFYADYEIVTWLIPDEHLILLNPEGEPVLYSIQERRFLDINEVDLSSGSESGA